MSWYLYRLLPHRPDFSSTMTAEEEAAMGDHVAYWSAHLEAGRVLAFGPVADPEHSWGFAIVEGEPDDLAELLSADPAVLAGFADADYLHLPALMWR